LKACEIVVLHDGAGRVCSRCVAVSTDILIRITLLLAPLKSWLVPLSVPSGGGADESRTRRLLAEQLREVDADRLHHLTAVIIVDCKLMRQSNQ